LRTVLAGRKQAGNKNRHHQRRADPSDDEWAASRERTAASLRQKNSGKMQPSDYEQDSTAKLTDVVDSRSHGNVTDLHK
jgi:hypothetical protein